THDDNAAGSANPAGDFGNVGFASRELGPWLQRRYALDAAIHICANDILRQRQMRDAAPGISGGDRLMENRRCLLRRGDGLSVNRNIAEQEIRLGRLEEVGAAQFAWHVAGERENRRMITARLIEASDQVRAARTGRAGAYPKPARELGLAGGGECRALLMADADPFDATA